MKIWGAASAGTLISLVVSVGAMVPAEAAVTCAGKTVTINLNTDPATPGTSGDDVILGTDEQEVIKGLGGNDVICSGGGGDNLQGGNGNDVIVPGAGDDTLFGGDGIDTVNYSEASAGVVFNLAAVNEDQITGGSGTDAMGGDFENLTGSPFDDFLFGTSGPNTLKGGTGDDYIQPHEGVDVVKGGGDSDLVDFSDAEKGLVIDLAVTTAQKTGLGSKTLTGVENITAGEFDDLISGSEAANDLRGGPGGDVIAGRGGNDDLFGQAGADELKGGTSNDVCDAGLDSDPDSHTGCEELINFT